VLFRCDPRNPCSGGLRSVADTIGGESARSQTAEHGYHGSHRTNTDKRIGAPRALVAHRCTGVWLFQSHTANPSEWRRPPRKPRSRSVVFRCDPPNPCSGGLRSVRHTTRGAQARSQTAEHGYHGSHRTNTDKRIGAPRALAVHRRTGVWLFQSHTANPSEWRRPPRKPRSRSVLFRCDPPNPCSGGLRSVRHTTRGAQARSQTAEHGYHGSHRPNPDKRIGAPRALAVHRRTGVWLFSYTRRVRQSGDVPRGSHGADPCCFGLIRQIRVPAVCDLSRTRSVANPRDRKLPEHGYHGSHGTNTDKRIGVPPPAPAPAPRRDNIAGGHGVAHS
jgi:hypothetical protein